MDNLEAREDSSQQGRQSPPCWSYSESIRLRGKPARPPIWWTRR
jgi:hypothetical protein